MQQNLHALAPRHIPFFVTAPGATDVLLNIMIVFVVCLFLLIGVFYLKLHALPDQIAHKNPNKMQSEIVMALAMIGMFTHNNNFWFAALILAMIRFPDYQSPLETIASGVTRLVNRHASAYQSSPHPPPLVVPDPAPAPRDGKI